MWVWLWSRGNVELQQQLRDVSGGGSTAASVSPPPRTGGPIPRGKTAQFIAACQPRTVRMCIKAHHIEKTDARPRAIRVSISEKSHWNSWLYNSRNSYIITLRLQSGVHGVRLYGPLKTDINICVNGTRHHLKLLWDTGCEKSLIPRKFVIDAVLEPTEIQVFAASDRENTCIRGMRLFLQ